MAGGRITEYGSRQQSQEPPGSRFAAGDAGKTRNGEPAAECKGSIPSGMKPGPDGALSLRDEARRISLSTSNPEEAWQLLRDWASKQPDPAAAMHPALFQILRHSGDPRFGAVLPEVVREASGLRDSMPLQARENLGRMLGEACAARGLAPGSPALSMAAAPQAHAAPRALSGSQLPQPEAPASRSEIRHTRPAEQPPAESALLPQPVLPSLNLPEFIFARDAVFRLSEKLHERLAALGRVNGGEDAPQQASGFLQPRGEEAQAPAVPDLGQPASDTAAPAPATFEFAVGSKPPAGPSARAAAAGKPHAAIPPGHSPSVLPKVLSFPRPVRLNGVREAGIAPLRPASGTLNSAPGARHTVPGTRQLPSYFHPPAAPARVNIKGSRRPLDSGAVNRAPEQAPVKRRPALPPAAQRNAKRASPSVKPGTHPAVRRAPSSLRAAVAARREKTPRRALPAMAERVKKPAPPHGAEQKPHEAGRTVRETGKKAEGRGRLGGSGRTEMKAREKKKREAAILELLLGPKRRARPGLAPGRRHPVQKK